MSGPNFKMLDSESIVEPITVIEKNAKTTRQEPCVFRLRGLAIWCFLIPEGIQGREEWPSPVTFNITHEQSGTRVAIIPDLRTAKLAVQILVQLGLDWTQTNDAIAAKVRRESTLVAVIAAVRQGRMVEMGLGVGVTPNMKGAAS